MGVGPGGGLGGGMEIRAAGEQHQRRRQGRRDGWLWGWCLERLAALHWKGTLPLPLFLPPGVLTDLCCHPVTLYACAPLLLFLLLLKDTLCCVLPTYLKMRTFFPTPPPNVVWLCFFLKHWERTGLRNSALQPRKMPEGNDYSTRHLKIAIGAPVLLLRQRQHTIWISSKSGGGVVVVGSWTFSFSTGCWRACKKAPAWEGGTSRKTYKVTHWIRTRDSFSWREGKINSSWDQGQETQPIWPSKTVDRISFLFKTKTALTAPSYAYLTLAYAARTTVRFLKQV